jgi:VanZ family protein
MTAIFALSSRSQLPGLGRFPDTVTHGIGYLVLSFLVSRALSRGPRLGWASLLLAVTLATAYGVSDEIHQAFVPGRHPDPWDVGKDALGAVLGALAYQGIAPRHRLRT